MSGPEKQAREAARLDATFVHHPRVPRHLRDGLVRYAVYGVAPGGFLRGVLANDLLEACGRADEESERALKPIIQWVYNEAPGPCWGSAAAVAAWIEEHKPAPRYDGPIEEGMRFVWEGDRPTARCVVEVVGFGEFGGERTIRGKVVEAGPLSELDSIAWNEESRFREAVVPFGGGAMIDPTEADIGRGVIYRAGSKLVGERERGVITSFNASAVFVRYTNGSTSAATSREDLTWEGEREVHNVVDRAAESIGVSPKSTTLGEDFERMREDGRELGLMEAQAIALTCALEVRGDARRAAEEVARRIELARKAGGAS